MADIDTLNGLLSDIATDTQSIGTEVAALNQELQAQATELANGGTVDLTSAITQATNIKTALDAVVAAAQPPASGGTTTTTTETPTPTAAAPADGSTTADQTAA